MTKAFLKIAILLFLSSLLFWSCAYYNTLFNAKKEYEQGIKIIQEEPDKERHPQADKHFSETIEKCWKLIEIYSDESKYADDALLYIIKSEIYMNKYAQARLHADKFISKYPKSELLPELHLWYAKIKLAENDVDEGMKYLNRSITNSNNSRIKAQANYELGNIAFQNENYEQAIEYFEKALKEEIDEQYAAFIQFYLAESYYNQERYKEAIERYKRVEKYSPSLDVEYKTKYNMANSYVELSRYKDALEILRKMLTAPRFKNFIPYIKTRIANTYHEQGRMEDALFLYKEVVSEKVSSSGTAQASLNLARIYEKEIQNIDSAVYYYGQVKKLYSKFDSVKVAEDKYKFLSELKNIQDAIKNDRRLVYRLENDNYFMDSLYTAQYEDSILQELKKISPNQTQASQQDTSIHVDTTATWYTYELEVLDSLRKSFEDSLSKVENDSISPFIIVPKDTIKKHLNDSLRVINRYILAKAQEKEVGENKKKQKKLEKRKLPQIQNDLKKNRYHLAEFFLLQVQNYDSALYYYDRFLEAYQDSVLTPKALYSKYYIFSQAHDRDSLNQKQDSLSNLLVSQYPESQFSRKILEKRGVLSDTTQQDSLDIRAKTMFRHAEKLYDNDLVDSALTVYQKVADLDTNLIWSAKAQLAIAWIYEKDKQNIDKAIEEYNYLKDSFDFPEFTAIASRKTAPPPKQASPGPAAGDSLHAGTQPDSSDISYAGLESSGQDTTTTAGIPIDEGKEGLPNISKSSKYREWRMNRSRHR